MTRIAVIGGGQMGEALVAGMINGGLPARNIIVCENNAERAAELSERYDILTTDIEDAVESSDYVFVAVKPKDVKTVLAVLADATGALENEVVVVSIAAGIPTVYYENQLSAGSPVIRVMPNTPMLVGEGVCAVSAGRYARPEHVEQVRGLLGSVGTVLEVPETDMDIVTAISGSGPAYFFLMVEAMIDAGVAMGLTRPVAAELAIGTIAGSAKMLQESGKTPAQLREAVTSPGGTTAAGLRAFEDGGFRSTICEVLDAVAEKSKEMHPKM